MRHAEKQGLKYRLLSDSEMTAAISFGIAFQVDNATIRKYKTYGIDFQANSGQKHHLLPVPSVFIIGKDGVIRFSYVNPNYKVRIEPGVLLKAAKAVAKRSPQQANHSVAQQEHPADVSNAAADAQRQP